MGYVNPTDRIAAACIAAVKPWRAKFDTDLAASRVIIADSITGKLVIRLVRQAARQGLSPADLDHENGTAALAAIADAIFSGKTKAAFYAALPNEWKRIIGAAQRIIDFEENPKRR